MSSVSILTIRLILLIYKTHFNNLHILLAEKINTFSKLYLYKHSVNIATPKLLKHLYTYSINVLSTLLEHISLNIY